MKITRPLFLVFLLNILGFGLLIFQRGTRGGLLIGAAAVAGLTIGVFIMVLLCNMGDPYLFLIASCLFTVGVVMLSFIQPDRAFRQEIWFVVALAGFFAAYFFYKKLRLCGRQLPLYIGGALLLFALTFVFGTTFNGSRNWIVVPHVGSIQPSELIKILYIFSLAAFFTTPLKAAEDCKTSIERLYNRPWIRKFVIMGMVYLHLGLLVLQREWGIGSLFFIIYFCMLFVCTNDYLLMGLNAAAVCVAGMVGYKVLYHIQTRVDMWRDPFSDPTGKGFQIVQSLFAIAAGGFTGTGIGQGSPELIPEVHSDFIFASICEETGILGGMGIIMLYFILIYRGFKITLAETQPFHKLVAFGITVMFAFQTFIIIGGVIKFIPLTGITMPFISYGGSSLLTSFMALGILQAISSNKEEQSDAI